MKVKNTNELWLKNNGKSDIKISDLNVKVKAGKVVNVYQYNPYLTVSQVEDSRKSGSLSKKLGSKLLTIVTKNVKPEPPTLDHVKESKSPLVKKSKSSVVIEQENDDPQETGSFDFADYGIADLGPVEQVNDGGTVSVQAKQDEKPEPKKDTEPPGYGLSLQSQMHMQDLEDKQSSAYGRPATTMNGPDKPFTVISPDLTPIVDEETGAVTVQKVKAAKKKYLNKIKRAQESGGLDDTEEGADDVIESEPTKFDTKVATVTEDGSVIMKLKEDTED